MQQMMMAGTDWLSDRDNWRAHVGPPLDEVITPWGPRHAKQRFWERWVEINRAEVDAQHREAFRP